MIKLSDREREVLALVAQGFTNNQTGARLGIAGSTVKIHLGHISKKLNLYGRKRLAAHAVQAGWVPSRQL